MASLTAPPLAAPVPAPSLRADFAWTLAGNSVYSLCQWGMLVVLAKLGSPEKVGQFALGLAVATPVIMFANLQLRSVQTTDVARRHRFGDYLGFRLLTSAAALLAVLAIVSISRHRSETAGVIVMVAVAQIVEAVSEVYYAQFQLDGRMDRIAVSMMARGPLSLALLGTMVWLTGSVFLGAAGLALGRLAVLAAYDLRASLQPPAWRTSSQQRLLRLALPLGAVSLLVALNANVPRYFIQGSLGERQLGIFSAIAFLLSSGNVVVGALGQSAFVRLATHYASGDLAAFRSLLAKLLAVGLFLGACGILVAQFAGRRILTILYRPEYARESHLLVWLMAAGAVGYLAQFIGYAMTAARYFHSQVPLFATVVLATTVSSWLLVPIDGLYGAILALFIGMVVQLAGSLVVLLPGIKRRRLLQAQAAGQA